MRPVDEFSERCGNSGKVLRMDDYIPPLKRPEDMPPVHTQAELYLHWRALGELGFGETLLWFLFFDADGRCTPVVGQIDDLPDVPDDVTLKNLLLGCRDVIEHEVFGGTVAFLRSRPGRAGREALRLIFG